MDARRVQRIRKEPAPRLGRASREEEGEEQMFPCEYRPLETWEGVWFCSKREQKPQVVLSREVKGRVFLNVLWGGAGML